MKSANELLLDRFIRHQTYLLRYAGGLRNESTDLLRKSEGKLNSLILKYSESLAGADLGLPGVQKQLDQMTSDIRVLRAQSWKAVHDTATKQMQALAQQEVLTAAKVITGSVPVILNLSIPPVAQLEAIAATRPFEGRTLKAWMDKAEIDDVARIAATAKIGIIQGDSPTAVARRVLGGGTVPTTRAAARKAFRDLESVYLTVTNGVQNESKKMFYEANPDLIQETYFVATLDSRTTLECASNDTKKFPVKEGPQPPLHFRCRSLRVPLLDADNLGSRPFNPTTEKQMVGEYADKNGLGKIKKRGDLPYGHKTKYDAFSAKRKRELIGQVPGKTSYQEWLTGQSPDFQNEVLGPTRAAMFRDGHITLDKFVARDGDTLTLDQLKSRGLQIPDDA